MRNSHRRLWRNPVALLAALAAVTAVPLALGATRAQAPAGVQWVSSSTALALAARFVDAGCPSGAAALGGGFSLDPKYGSATETFNPPKTIRTGAMLLASGPTPGGNAWRAGGYTNGSSSSSVTAHAACIRRAGGLAPLPGRIRDIEYVFSGTATGTRGGDTAAATCPAGKFVLGGSVAVLPPVGRPLLVTQSMPETSPRSPAPNVWRGSARELGTFRGFNAHTPWSLRVTAVCATLGAPPTKAAGVVTDITTVQTSASAGSGTTMTSTAVCPVGWKAIGASAWISNTTRARVTSVRLQDRAVMVHAATDPDPPNWSLTAHATCAKV